MTLLKEIADPWDLDNKHPPHWDREKYVLKEASSEISEIYNEDFCAVALALWGFVGA